MRRSLMDPNRNKLTAPARNPLTETSIKLVPILVNSNTKTIALQSHTAMSKLGRGNGKGVPLEEPTDLVVCVCVCVCVCVPLCVCVEKMGS